MIYDYYFIFNTDEFEATGLISRNMTVTLDQIGQKEFLITKGNLLGITYEGEFLPLELNDKNPFEFENFAIYKDDNNDVWFGLNGREPE